MPGSSPFSYLGFHWKEALLHMLEGTIMFSSHTSHFLGPSIYQNSIVTLAVTGICRPNTSHQSCSVAAF